MLYHFKRYHSTHHIMSHHVAWHHITSHNDMILANFTSRVIPGFVKGALAFWSVQENTKTWNVEMALIQIGCPLALQPPWQVRSVDALLPYSGMQETVGGCPTGSWKSERAGKKRVKPPSSYRHQQAPRPGTRKAEVTLAHFVSNIRLFFAFFPL